MSNKGGPVSTPLAYELPLKLEELALGLGYKGATCVELYLLFDFELFRD